MRLEKYEIGKLRKEEKKDGRETKIKNGERE